MNPVERFHASCKQIEYADGTRAFAVEAKRGGAVVSRTYVRATTTEGARRAGIELLRPRAHVRGKRCHFTARMATYREMAQ